VKKKKTDQIPYSLNPVNDDVCTVHISIRCSACIHFDNVQSACIELACCLPVIRYHCKFCMHTAYLLPSFKMLFLLLSWFSLLHNYCLVGSYIMSVRGRTRGTADNVLLACSEYN
jgi:hypothetical protein